MTHAISKNKIIYAITILFSIAIIFYFSPITQSQAYHNFAEQRLLFNIPHFGDVLSNLAFIITGIVLYKQSRKWTVEELYFRQKIIFNCFCVSSIALGLGSGYYHWNPNDATLAWDRATMVLGFAIIFYDSLIRYEIASNDHPLSGTLSTTFAFLLTVVFWTSTGKLEPYVFVQFFTMFALVLLAIRNYKRIPSQHLFDMFIWYTVAKICESQDTAIFYSTHGLISGHTLKHLSYAMALYVFGRNMLKRRKLG